MIGERKHRCRRPYFDDDRIQYLPRNPSNFYAPGQPTGEQDSSQKIDRFPRPEYVNGTFGRSLLFRPVVTVTPDFFKQKEDEEFVDKSCIVSPVLSSDDKRDSESVPFDHPVDATDNTNDIPDAQDPVRNLVANKHDGEDETAPKKKAHQKMHDKKKRKLSPGRISMKKMKMGRSNLDDISQDNKMVALVKRVIKEEMNKELKTLKRKLKSYINK